MNGLGPLTAAAHGGFIQSPDNRGVAPARSRGLILLLGSLTAIAPMSIDMYLPAFPALQASLGTNPAAIERTLSAFFIGLSTGQLAYGPLADRFGRRRPLLVGLALFAVASLGCATAMTAGQLQVWRALQALGGCAGIVVARAVVRDVFGPREAARVLSSLMLVMGLAPILAPIFGGWLVGVAGWRAIFGVLAVFGVALIIGVARGLPDTAPANRAPSMTVGGVASAFVRVARHPRFQRFALVSALGSCTLFAYIAAAPFLYMQVLALTPAMFALVFGINAAGLVVASQLNRRLLQAWEVGPVLRSALGIQVLAALALVGATWLLVPRLAGVVAPVFVVVLLLGFVLPNGTALALAPFDRDAGTASALLGSTQYGLSGLATLAVGLLHDGTTRPTTAAILAFVVLAGLLSLSDGPARATA